jgi:NitT/TauT family transport system substrate-binding protein
MSRRLGRWALALCLVLGLTAVAGCGDDSGGGGGGGENKQVTVKVGTLPISNAAPLYLGVKKGFFRNEKITVEPALAEGGAEIITSLVSGSDQFGFVGYVPAIVARSRNVPVKVIANSDNGAATANKEWTIIAVSKDSPIRNVQDLAGKTISVNALKGVGEVAIKGSLQKQGVDISGIKLLEVPFPEMPAALERGQVDAVWVAEPFLTAVLGTGARQIDAPLVTLGKNFENGTYVTSEKYLNQNEDVVKRFTRAINRSNAYASTHPAEVRAVIPEFTKIPPAVAKKIRLPVWPPEIDRAQVQQLADYSKRYELIKEVPSLDDLIWSGASTK